MGEKEVSKQLVQKWKAEKPGGFVRYKERWKWRCEGSCIPTPGEMVNYSVPQQNQ